jgi:hypothetical protein
MRDLDAHLRRAGRRVDERRDERDRALEALATGLAERADVIHALAPDGDARELGLGHIGEHPELRGIREDHEASRSGPTNSPSVTSRCTTCRRSRP